MNKMNKQDKTKCKYAYFLLGDSAKHFNEDVSTTVSQNVTTGSATLISKWKQQLVILQIDNNKNE